MKVRAAHKILNIPFTRVASHSRGMYLKPDVLTYHGLPSTPERDQQLLQDGQVGFRRVDLFPGVDKQEDVIGTYESVY